MNDAKVVLITGASSGMGQATAALLKSRGYHVFGTTRKLNDGTLPSGVEGIRLDVREDPSVEACVASVMQSAGRIDVLINNAGYGMAGAVEETSLDEALALFDTNLFGALRTMRAVLPIMRNQRGGRIINTSSVLGFLPAPFFALYASTKHALEGLSESLDHEVRRFGIRVVLIEPNFTNTRFDANWSRPVETLADYAPDLRKAKAAFAEKVRQAAGPDLVAIEILHAIEGPHRMRRPVGFQANLLSRLRRFMPAGPVDRNIRKTFGLT